MKKIGITYITLIVFTITGFSQTGEFCQYTYPSTWGCNNNFWIIDSASNPNCIWQYGTTDKPFFVHTGPALTTDTLNDYPPNNYSTMSMILTTTGFEDIYNIERVSLDMMFNLDTDTLNDGGYAEFSLDNGLTWENSFEFSGDPMISSLYNGERGITGRFNYVWLNFINVDISLFAHTDTVLFRIVFASDSIQSNKSGWQIIGLEVWMWASSVDNELIPLSEDWTIPTQMTIGKNYNFPTEQNNRHCEIYDLSGRIVKTFQINESGFRIDESIKPGLYLFSMQTKSGFKRQKVMIDY